jgi:hypothetical protein
MGSTAACPACGARADRLKSELTCASRRVEIVPLEPVIQSQGAETWWPTQREAVLASCGGFTEPYCGGPPRVRSREADRCDAAWTGRSRATRLGSVIVQDTMDRCGCRQFQHTRNRAAEGLGPALQCNIL